MENNEKLLEAAMTIRDHCKKNGILRPCIFAVGGRCLPDVCVFHRDLCGLRIPAAWNLPKGTGKWTQADKALATGLKANGYNSVTRACDNENVIVIGREKTALELGQDFFTSLACNEVVNLDEIIGEDEDGKDF